MSLLAFRDVTCVRGGRVLFEALSFALEPGGAALVTGANGAGKSSLIRVAAGLLRPASGRVEGDAPCALLTDAASLDEELPLAKALGFWAGLDGRGKKVNDALTALELNDLAEIPVRLLSTGQRRRAAFARLVVSGAPVWLLDEPANGLDAEALGRLEDAIASHRADGGTVVVASHSPIALPDARAIHLRLPGEGRGPVTSGPMLDPGVDLRSTSSRRGGAV
ncbi:MAG: heme ABC exporter ATP-binding protein CcmA [Sphingomonas sp.]